MKTSFSQVHLKNLILLSEYNSYLMETMIWVYFQLIK